MPRLKRHQEILEPPLAAPLVIMERPEPVLEHHPEQHPDDIPLDHVQVEAALWQSSGNVHRAAALLNTRPGRVQYLIERVPHLKTTRIQAADLLVDRAELTLHNALEDQADPARQDNAARFILEKAGKSRGWSKDGGALNLAFDPQTPSVGQIAIRWDIGDK